jgi:hypothetical protein
MELSELHGMRNNRGCFTHSMSCPQHTRRLRDLGGAWRCLPLRPQPQPQCILHAHRASQHCCTAPHRPHSAHAPPFPRDHHRVQARIPGHHAWTGLLRAPHRCIKVSSTRNGACRALLTQLPPLAPVLTHVSDITGAHGHAMRGAPRTRGALGACVSNEQASLPCTANSHSTHSQPPPQSLPTRDHV